MDCPTCDAGHVPKQTFNATIVMEDGSLRTITMGERALTALQNYLDELRMIDHQRRCATRFNRHRRSIRATKHLVRR